MNQLISSQEMTMGTREIAEMLGKEHSNIKISAERLYSKGVLLTLAAQGFEHNGNNYTEYRLNKRDCLILVAQNCPEFTAAIVDRWQELESASAQQRIPTHNEAFLQLFQSAVEQDRVIKEQGERLIAVENKLEKAIEANVWDHCPQNCEPITKIRQRINERYGISAKIVDQVMRDMPFSPRIAGMVRNGNENAQGSHYAVYHTKDVSNVFKMFVSECEQVTKEFFKHQLIAKSFKLKL